MTTDRRTLIWEEGAQKGSNVDVSTFHELDRALRDLYGGYDSALKLWSAASDEHTIARIEHIDTQAKVHAELRPEFGDKITHLKREVEFDKRVKKAWIMMIQAEGTLKYAERLITKIETQRSMVQSRVKMLMSQSKWDRGSQLD